MHGKFISGVLETPEILETNPSYTQMPGYAKCPLFFSCNFRSAPGILTDPLFISKLLQHPDNLKTARCQSVVNSPCYSLSKPEIVLQQ